MSKFLIKYGTWTTTELRDYFCPRDGRSAYSLQQPFQPGMIDGVNTAQLHETERHEGGAGYVHLSNGHPDLKNDVIAALDGFKFEVMAEAMAFVQQRAPELHHVLSVMAWRGKKKKTTVATEVDLSPATLDRWINEGIDLVSVYLDQLLASQAKEAA